MLVGSGCRNGAPQTAGLRPREFSPSSIRGQGTEGVASHWQVALVRPLFLTGPLLSGPRVVQRGSSYRGTTLMTSFNLCLLSKGALSKYVGEQGFYA